MRTACGREARASSSFRMRDSLSGMAGGNRIKWVVPASSTTTILLLESRIRHGPQGFLHSVDRRRRRLRGGFRGVEFFLGDGPRADQGRNPAFPLGPMAISENSMVDAELLAIDEINAKGGLLGRRIEPVIADGKSDWPTFAKEAERLITQEDVSVIFGCWTSASRKTVAPVIKKYGQLMVYPMAYEGLEQSPNIPIDKSTSFGRLTTPSGRYPIRRLARKPSGTRF